MESKPKVERLEKVISERSRRIAHAIETGDVSGLSQSDLMYVIARGLVKWEADDLSYIQNIGLSETDLRAVLQGDVKSMSHVGLDLFIDRMEARLEQ